MPIPARMACSITPSSRQPLFSGGNLILTGWARPGSIIEFFIAAPDASGGLGSGKTYLTTLTEGSGADTDATSSTYGPGAINGILQGTDTTNRFQFTIATPGGVVIGTVLTATATLSGNTSEFSGNVTVFGLPNLLILNWRTRHWQRGDIITYTETITNTGTGTATSVVVTDSLSPYVQWGLNSYGAGVAFQFVNGTPASGLTLGTPVYSNDSGSTWAYTPVSGGGGAPAGYDGNITNWSIPMSGTIER